MICNKCHQDKPETEYQTYYHSSQGVYRTRRQCTQCYYDVKKLYRLKVMGRACIVCEEIKYEIDFPNYKSLGPTDRRRKVCKVCTSRIHKEKGIYTKRINKGEVVLNRPNTYISEQQRIDGFQLMEALGFTFVEQTGRWHKEGFKNPDGTFFRIEEKKRIEKEKRLKQIEQLDVWEKVIYLLGQGHSINQISEDTGVNKTALYKFTKYGQKVQFRN